LEYRHGRFVRAYAWEDDDIGFIDLGWRGDVDDGVAAGGDGVADGADVAGSVVEEGYGERHGLVAACDLEAFWKRV